MLIAWREAQKKQKKYGSNRKTMANARAISDAHTHSLGLFAFVRAPRASDEIVNFLFFVQRGDSAGFQLFSICNWSDSEGITYCTHTLRRDDFNDECVAAGSAWLGDVCVLRKMKLCFYPLGFIGWFNLKLCERRWSSADKTLTHAPPLLFSLSFGTCAAAVDIDI